MTNTGSLLAKKLTIPVDYLFWRSHARFIVENISAAVIAINAGGFITIFNSEAETVFNKPAVKVLGKHVRDVFPGIPEHEQYILQVLKTGKEVSNKESGYCPYTNCEGFYQHNVALVKGMQGEVTGAIWMRKDLTSEHRFQKEISNAEVQAIVSQIAAGAAHEIRNPLTTAKGYIQLALQQSTDNNVIKEYLGMATEEIQQIERIITDFLALIHPGAEGLQFVSPNNIIKDLLNLVENVGMMVDIEIISELDMNMPLCLLDHELVKQAVLNVLRNAIQAMPSGGKLIVRTQYLPEPGQALISVSDTGLGIRKEDLARVFTPFYSTRVEGSGLGLTLTNRIVQHHNGYVKVKSEENRGTTIDLYLPVSQ
ncbi:MAG: ATP-binding protein [Bacillota bacterium]|nr:ATP-binding protein [Bacillota bacterium]MDW7683737.1 ATP-binding protein [Bacillota bacterium]